MVIRSITIEEGAREVTRHVYTDGERTFSAEQLRRLRHKRSREDPLFMSAPPRNKKSSPKLDNSIDMDPEFFEALKRRTLEYFRKERRDDLVRHVEREGVSSKKNAMHHTHIGGDPGETLLKELGDEGIVLQEDGLLYTPEDYRLKGAIVKRLGEYPCLSAEGLMGFLQSPKECLVKHLAALQDTKSVVSTIGPDGQKLYALRRDRERLGLSAGRPDNAKSIISENLGFLPPPSAVVDALALSPKDVQTMEYVRTGGGGPSTNFHTMSRALGRGRSDLRKHVRRLIERGLIKQTEAESPTGNSMKRHTLTEEGRYLLDSTLQGQIDRPAFDIPSSSQRTPESWVKIRRHGNVASLADVPYKGRMVLAAVAVAAERYGGTPATGDIREAFNELAVFLGEDTSEDVYVDRSLKWVGKQLERGGLLQTTVVSRGRYGRTTTYELKGSPESVLNELMGDTKLAAAIERVRPGVSKVLVTPIRQAPQAQPSPIAYTTSRQPEEMRSPEPQTPLPASPPQSSA